MNERSSGGGTEAQVDVEARLLQSRGHVVWKVTLDSSISNIGDASGKNHVNIPVPELTGPRRWARQLGGSSATRSRLDSILSELSPDVIHLNNAYESPRDVYDAISRYPTVQTIRDYSAICPRDTCIDDMFSECPGYMQASCGRCRPAPATALKHIKLARINSFRKRAVNVMVAPSNRLAEKCRENCLQVSQIRDCIDSDKSSARPDVIPATLAFLYFGRISRQKGVERLLSVFGEFAQSSGARLRLAGTVDHDMKDLLDHYSNRPWLDILGHLETTDLKTVLGDTYCVVVPSLWMENYPNTAMEAMAGGVLVIGSNRGGLPEMLQSEDQLFDVLDDDAILACLRRVASLSAADYLARSQQAKTRVLQDNSVDNYYLALMDAFTQAIDSHRHK